MKKTTKFPLTYLLLTTTLWAYLGTLHAANNILIDDAWVREAPPNAKILAGYLQIKNRSTRDITLTDVSSANFKQVEMHNTVVEEDGTATMQKQNEITIAAQGRVNFKPGAQHLMLIAPHKRLKAGDTVELSLVFSDGSKHKITAMVRKSVPGRAAQSHDHHHHDHAAEHHKDSIERSGHQPQHADDNKHDKHPHHNH